MRPFFIYLSKVEYITLKLMDLAMCIMLSINKQLQKLENQNIIKKYHRVAYLDLLTYDNTFSEFSITQELLQRLLNLSKAQVCKILSFLEQIGLIRRIYNTSHDGQRAIANTIVLQLVDPLEMKVSNFTSTLFSSSALTTFAAKFISIDNCKSRASIFVKDVFGQYEDKELYMEHYFLDYNAENAKFIDDLYERDLIEFLAVAHAYKTQKGKDAWHLYQVQKFKLI